MDERTKKERKHSQRAHNVEATLIQHLDVQSTLFNVVFKTLNRRCSNVVRLLGNALSTFSKLGV